MSTNTPINFCAIAPTKYLHLVRDRPVHLLLAHLVEEDTDYREFYCKLKQETPSVQYILDNSCFERYKAGLPMFESSKLLELGKLVSADYIVLSDYPDEPGQTTINAALKLIPEFKSAGFKTFFCPQSRIGDLDDLIDTFKWAINNPDIDLIGVSILACPNAFGIKQTKYNDDGKADEMYRLQRYLSRYETFSRLAMDGLLGPKTQKKFHLLGLVDGYKELSLLSQFAQHIYSNDSSSPCWHGIHGIRYDDTPTGLALGKFEKEVDFDLAFNANAIDNIQFNLARIDSCLERVNI